MGVANLGSSRGLIGTFFKTLQMGAGMPSWVDKISMEFTSNQLTEIYRWLGMVPTMREWIGPRQAKGFYDNTISATNKRYEATLEVLVEDIRRDNTGQTRMRIADLARRTNSHWASLLTTLIIAGESTACYDGQYFFDDDHTEGNNTTSQSNDLSIDISALPAAVHSGSTTAPSSQEMALVILQMIQAIMGFKDNENEPMGEDASSFLIMCPVSLTNSVSSAIGDMTFGGGETNQLRGFAREQGFNIEFAVNPRLTWTAQVCCFRTDDGGKGLIRQNEKPVELKTKAEGSEYEFDNDAWQFGVDASRTVQYGFWQDACLATMV
jgi:phage major head subunit gpT-like protein